MTTLDDSALWRMVDRLFAVTRHPLAVGMADDRTRFTVTLGAQVWEDVLSYGARRGLWRGYGPEHEPELERRIIGMRLCRNPLLAPDDVVVSFDWLPIARLSLSN